MIQATLKLAFSNARMRPIYVTGQSCEGIDFLDPQDSRKRVFSEKILMCVCSRQLKSN